MINPDYEQISLFGVPFSEHALVQVDITAEFNELESGRGTIRLTSNSVKQCAGFSVLIYAEQDGFGVYDLYRNKEAWTNGDKLGTAIKKDSSLQINFSSDSFSVWTIGRKTTRCIFNLGNNFYSDLAIKK